MTEKILDFLIFHYALLGSCPTWAVVQPGQLPCLGSCLHWQLLPGQLSAWAVVLALKQPKMISWLFGFRNLILFIVFNEDIDRKFYKQTKTQQYFHPRNWKHAHDMTSIDPKVMKTFASIINTPG